MPTHAVATSPFHDKSRCVPLTPGLGCCTPTPWQRPREVSSGPGAVALEEAEVVVVAAAASVVAQTDAEVRAHRPPRGRTRSPPSATDAWAPLARAHRASALLLCLHNSNTNSDSNNNTLNRHNNRSNNPFFQAFEHLHRLPPACCPGSLIKFVLIDFMNPCGGCLRLTLRYSNHTISLCLWFVFIFK